MKLLPDPLHPAIVHFPIVLILLGTVIAICAVFWRRQHVPLVAGILLTLGAVGAWVSVETGESDGGLVESRSAQADSLLDAHENWAKRTLGAAAVAAVAALMSLALVRLPRTARVLAVVTAIAAMTASYAVYETGHRGGALVYKHGAGVGTTDVASSARASEADRD
jgi:uncharacterized membrane protein